MKALILDPNVVEQLVSRRRALGQDLRDEVWDGVWHMVPSPNKDHQLVVMLLAPVLHEVVHGGGLGQVLMQFNVADPVKGFQDFRIPDISVVTNGSTAVVMNTYIAEGPDLVIEVRSPGDETDEKIPWYALQGVRELLVIERDTLAPRLYRRDGERLIEVPATDEGVRSLVVPLGFRCEGGPGAPSLVVYDLRVAGRTWRVPS